jgi:hypothetical protein|tara:strand:+ start:274 stop:1221 length:948 start_codon:yes stop_codon:yes gene_type:complete
MTQTKRFLVYVASNHAGLESERYEVTRQLARMGILTCGFPCREDTSPYDWNLARSQIEDADLFLMILGDDYGPMAPTGISYLHREFVHAQSLSKPVLSFIKNSLPSPVQTDSHRRLAGFHNVISKTSCRLWHLREELVSHVKTAVVNALSNKSGGWQKLEATDLVQIEVESNEAPLKVDNKQWLQQSRQLIRLQLSAKVYEAGNNTLEEISVSLRWDAIFACAARLMSSPASEEKIRAALEELAQEEVKGRLLKKHPLAHAIDDIRINRAQFTELVKQWLQHGLVVNKSVSGRDAWKLSAQGITRLISISAQKAT